MRTLSKSKLLAFRQCPKRLWLEIHAPQLREDSGATLRTPSQRRRISPALWLSLTMPSG